MRHAKHSAGRSSPMKPGFLWGVATSAYQSEGGYNLPGQPQTNWARFERQLTVAPLGQAAAFWRHYREDFDTCRSMGLSAFRLSIEWSRVQPTLRNEPASPPPFNDEALNQYAQIIDDCIARGLEPIVTLHHFVHPAWLGPDPWLNPAAVEHFGVYVRKVVQHVNQVLISKGKPPVRYFITINEPNMLVLNTYLGSQFPTSAERSLLSATTACNNLLCAHILAYNCIHDLYEAEAWAKPMVTLNTFTSDLYWSDKALFDLLAMRERQVHSADSLDYLRCKARDFNAVMRDCDVSFRHDLEFYTGITYRKVCQWTAEYYLSSVTFKAVVERLYESPRSRVMDYLAMDYYDPFCAHAFRLPRWWDHEYKNRSLRDWVTNSVTSKWWDWRVLPKGLRFFCEYYARDFGNRPMLIAENGMALRRDLDNRASPRSDQISRSEFLEMHTREIIDMVRDGVPLFGYMHWSLFDNYEWGTFSPRFGIFSLDYQKGTKRIATDHCGDCPSATYARIIKEVDLSPGVLPRST
jgi:beta-glucosidase